MKSSTHNGHGRRTIEYKFLRQYAHHDIPKIRYVSGIFLMIFQFAFFLLYGFFVSYSNKTDDVAQTYPRFIDIHTMVFIGFGFLMTFLKRYGYGSIGYNFLIAAYSLQWALLIRGWFGSLVTGEGNNGLFSIGIPNLISADFCAIAVLISMGSVIGKASLSQLIVMATFEVVLQSLNEFIGVKYLQGYDVGKSIYVHLFGAYFGLAVSKIIQKNDMETSKDSSHYNSDLLAMIGTLFLWIYWPSYNSAAAVDEGQTRAIINTYLALTSSCVATFILSLLVGKGRLNMIHIQNATLAGGVAVGAVADMIIQPFGAMLIGSVAGIISTLGYQYITPFLNDVFVHDTCGVNNIHGLPGILSGIASAVVAALATRDTYGDRLFTFYPSRSAPIESASTSSEGEGFSSFVGNETESTTSFPRLFNQNATVGVGRSAIIQGGFQMATLALSITMAILGGLLTGLIMRLPIIEQIEEEDEMFDDEANWITPEDFSLKLTEVSIQNQPTEEEEIPLKVHNK